ncbi:MAG: hypothetical protein PWP23_2802 [Candidatus Sumerlaeota bacterium]|nr:hypothetical protein [Candidatus Sumerlaeota bacterium]
MPMSNRPQKEGGVGTLVLALFFMAFVGGAAGLWVGLWAVRYVRYLDDGGLLSVSTLGAGALAGAAAGVVAAIKFWRSGE